MSVVLGLAIGGQSFGADSNEAFINFAYAAQLGIGRYEVGDLTVSTFKLPLAFALRKGDDERWGATFKIPITAGHYEAPAEIPGFEILQEADAFGLTAGFPF